MERSKSGSAVRSGPGRQMLRRCVVLAAVFGIGVFAPWIFSHSQSM